MVTAYWHIGREMVEALQRGSERAAYGKVLIDRLAVELTARYGKGFSATNLGYFRQFYLAYRDRIPHAARGELPRAFNPNLTWTLYRSLMRVTDADARGSYEAEATRANWSHRDLDRQIHESDLEDAIITRLQHFLLELGRGFSFVARQQRIRFADKDFYVDLVF
jgi:hypothetical protein